MERFPQEFVFLVGAHMDQVMRLDALPLMGSSNPATMSFSPGGAALNSASIAAGLGLKCQLVSPVGNDPFASQLHQALKERGVGNGLVRGEGTTGIYAAMFDPVGDLVIGAAGLAIYDEIDGDWIENALGKYRNTGSGVFVNANLTENQLNEAISGFDFVAAATISPGKAPRLRPFLANTDLLFSNRKEAIAMLGLSGGVSGSALVDALVDAGVKAGTVSDGANLLCWWNGAARGTLEPPSVKAIVDVNGAGDALAGAVLACLAAGMSFRQAVEQAMLVAAETLCHEGPYPPDIQIRFQRLLKES